MTRISYEIKKKVLGEVKTKFNESFTTAKNQQRT